MIAIIIPTALQKLTGEQREVSAEGQTVGEVLAQLARRFPQIRQHLFTPEGQLRHFVNLFVNEEDIRHLQGLDTALKGTDTLLIVPSIAGGQDIPLTPQDRQRYSRHLLLPDVGEEGQKKLKAAKVLLVGAGGLGSPAAYYLAAAGVGTLGLVDFDTVDLSNLQRQILHTTDDVGRPKLESAKEKLVALNPHVRVKTYATKLTSENALEIIKEYDIVIDGTDNFPTRYLVNDACVLLGKPDRYGSIFQFEGQASVFGVSGGPCYRCLYREPPPPGLVPSCAEGGVLGVLPGLIGTIQATEAVKLILGQGTPLVGRLLLYDALTMEFRELKVRKDPGCPLCGPNPTITGLIDYQAFCKMPKEEGPKIAQIPPKEAQALLKAKKVRLIDVREPFEYEICHIDGAELKPLGQMDQWAHGLDKRQDYLLQCHTGRRSQKAAEALAGKGFQVKNLAGGIQAWAEEIEPGMATY